MYSREIVNQKFSDQFVYSMHAANDLPEMILRLVKFSALTWIYIQESWLSGLTAVI